MPAAPRSEEISFEEARNILFGAAALHAHGHGAEGARAMINRLGILQLDPIDRIGANADLVAFARVDGLVRGDIHRHTFGITFEHFAKERCLIHARFFAHYRGRAVETPWWRHSERMKKLAPSLLEEVRAEIHERGPVPAQALTHRGHTEAMDWAGWKGTSSLAALAAEVLWTRCEVIATGRDPRGRRLYTAPNVLGAWANAAPEGDFGEEMVVSRVRTAGLLSRAGGPQWSMLTDARTDGTVERLLEEGRLRQVRIRKRPYLVLADPPVAPPDDGRMRVLGPLDALIWDRTLVRDLFGFDYIWEIYKPEAERIWGYYVCPLLHGGRLVGRIEARRDGQTLVVDRLWGSPDEPALRDELRCLSQSNGCTDVSPLPTPAGDA